MVARTCKRAVQGKAAVWAALALWPAGALAADAPPPKVVVFCERGFPYFGANQAISPRVVVETLKAVGINAQLADVHAVAGGALKPADVKCLVWVYGNTFPREAAGAIEEFHRHGGCIVATGVPFTHPCTPVERGGRVFWRDEGHEDFGGHDRIGIGRVGGFVPGHSARLAPVPGAPFELTPMRYGMPVQSYSVPAGVGGFFFLGTADLPREDQVSGVIGVEDGGRPLGVPVAILRHGCERFRGAVDVWAGTQWLCDPRDPAEVLLARQLILRSVVYALEASASLAPQEARAVRARVADWCRRHVLPQRRLLKYSGKPRPRLLPASPTLSPNASVTVHPVTADPQDVRTALACLQGHVNRREPRLYLEYTEHDAKWLAWYRERGYVGQIERIENADEVVARFRTEVAGAVISEERFVNIATMLASVVGGIACTPELAARWSLPVIADLRGRWRTDAQAYRWAFDRLWPQMSHQVLCCGHPRRSPQQTDYLVAHRIFTFFVSGATDAADEGKDPVEETLLAEKLLAATEPNSAVLGWWGWGDPPEGIGEYWGMTLASRYAKVTIGTEFMTNMSFHSAVPGPKRLRQELLPREPRLPLDRTKVYVAAAVLDSGNDPWYWLRPQRDVWEAPGRGQTPLGWIIGPALHDLAPGIAEWYYRHLTPRDELICALSGLGYMNIPDYATAFTNRDALLRDYLAMTRQYMERLDLRTLQTYHGSWGEPSDYGRKGDLALFARCLPGLVALLPDVGRHNATTYDIANYLLPGYGGRSRVPVFHCLTRWIPWYYTTDLLDRPEDAEIAGLVREVQAMTPPHRPAFLLAFVLSWTFRPEMVNAAARQLGPEYVFVTPSELAALFLEYKATHP